MIKSESEKYNELRAKVNKAAFHRNISVFFTLIFFLAWVFEWTPCAIGNIYLFFGLFTFNAVLIIQNIFIALQLKVYATQKK